MKNLAIYCGRFGPVHLGHEKVIESMVKDFAPEDCLVVIGSSNNNFSLRHFFTYQERRDLIKKLFPNIKVIGLPDYATDQEWLRALDDIILAINANPSTSTFYGGCEEDILFFFDDGRKCQIVNRFDGTTPKISATEVRDCLIYDRSLDGLINPVIQEDLKLLFGQKWEKFKKI